MVFKHLGLSARAHQSELVDALRAIVTDLELPTGFSDEALADARRAIEQFELPSIDMSDVEFVTIDPPTSTDLDQAVHIEYDGDGYRVRYAIADVPAFVKDGGPLDAETRLRGQTVYLPHERIGLHPEIISEDAGSLLPDQRRSAFVWTLDVAADGRLARTDLVRAVVVSRAKLHYEQVQEMIDGLDGARSNGSLPGGETLAGLRDVGRARLRRERERGGASLRLPEQEVEVNGDGHYVLAHRSNLPAEEWNAQISLMTGIAAARIMLDGGVGILRTMPAPDPKQIAAYRRQAIALGHPWDDGVTYGEFLDSLDIEDPSALALMYSATVLFRGAGYTAFDGELPEETEQAAIAAPYAHTTAPLRRLIDRFVLVACWHLVHEEPVPGWVREALPELPGHMGASGQRASAAERQAIDAVEAALLAGRVGEAFDAVVIEEGMVQILEPAITAKLDGGDGLEPVPGQRVRVELTEADIAARRVRFEVREILSE
ncbi:RNB domain-containing ribonuclease [Zhihengliuella salsuginis]|uniref:Exoribonuclease R n=1 Tax=Zhihengliuella salsuginis TaxID=578222 RepID=A0ABQ3GF53_9MICC|nr:RNB domain-containing ribonuclease [Zhihengliuella salsuginis]GHD03735.1 exoribonuclease R [Zhihengliuella salsuginis]